MALSFSHYAFSDDKAINIIKKADEVGRGWGSNSADVDMDLYQPQRGIVYRTMKVRNLEVIKGGDKSMTLILSPPDMKGTVLLTHSNIDSPDDQWLLLPALKRIKRISSHNKSSPFMGSEFAFEDLASFEIKKYHYEFLREENNDGELFYVIKYTPAYENSGYESIVHWIDEKYYRVSKAEYYDRSGRHFKTLEYLDYILFKNKFWRAQTMKMKNILNGNITTLKWNNIDFSVDYTRNDFRRNSIEKYH
jgi:hypothetical protein